MSDMCCVMRCVRTHRSSTLKIRSTSDDCNSEARSAPVVAAALQQRLICALTGARPSAMLRRGDDDGDGSTKLKGEEHERRLRQLA
jgi:hypothetical protein